MSTTNYVDMSTTNYADKRIEY